jgi:hypothetical protein
MITKYRCNSQAGIPDGEGFNALPIAFNVYRVIARRVKTRRGNLGVELEIASSQRTLLATTLMRGDL